MFVQHFKLNAQPFAERVAAADFWLDERMRVGLDRLRQLVEEHNTLGVLAGPSGVGKSALIKRFLHEWDGPAAKAVYLHLTHLPAAGLLKLVVGQLGEAPKRGKDRLFAQILAKAKAANGSLLLVLDEAHLLDNDALVDLRLLVSSGLDDAPPLRILLAGQETLLATLRQTTHLALRARMSVACELHPLTKEETVRYIDHRLKVAGGSEKLFETAVKHTIHEYTGGVPRQINNVATACLMLAAAQQGNKVTDAVLHQTISDFRFS